MIEIGVADGMVRIRALNETHPEEVAALFNSSEDMRYATGTGCMVTAEDMAESLKRISEERNEFAAGIFLEDAGCLSDEAGPAQHYERMERKGSRFAQSGDSEPDSARRNEPQLVGLITGALLEKAIWIRLMAIHPRFRRQGLGARSVGLILEYGRARYRTETAYLSLVETNSAGVGFWTGLGFSEAGRFKKKLFGDERPYWVIIMQKKL